MGAGLGFPAGELGFWGSGGFFWGVWGCGNCEGGERGWGTRIFMGIGVALFFW